MRKAIKWTVISVASGLVLVGLVAAYIAATFDPNAYKAQIIEAVQQKTGRSLKLEGDIGISLFPSLGAKLGQTSLSEPRNDRPFASFTGAIVSVKVMPLLAKEVVVDALEVKGLRLNVQRDKAGRMNFDDLVGAEKKPQEKPATPVKVDIGRIELSDADVSFSDQAAGTRYRLSKLDLKTGRVANGVTTPIDLSATVASDKDKAQLETKLKTKLTFDLERQLYRLEGFDFSAKGNYAGISNMHVTAKGNLEARMKTGEYIANAVDAAVTGKRTDGDLNVKLDAPRLTLTQDKVDGGKIAVEATVSEPKSKLTAKITVGAVQGAFKSLNAAPLEADIDMSGEGRTTKAKLAGALAGNLDTKVFELPKLSLTANVKDAKLPKGGFDVAIAGSARANLDKSTAGLDFSGKLDDSNVQGKAGVTRFSPLAVTFDLDADQLDADKLMGKTAAKPASAKPGKEDGGAGKDGNIDLSALKGIDATGSVRIGKLTLLNLKSAQVRANIKVADGHLDLAQISAQLYQGALNGSISAQAASQAIFAVKQTLSGVAVGPLLRDAAQIDTLDGRGTINVDLRTQGATVQALKKALNGTAAVNLADGSIKGIDIAGTIRTARTKIDQLRGQQVQSSNKAEKTDFTELKATFRVKNGVARNDDLSMKSPLLRVGGAGDIDIGNDRLNYVLKATLVATSKGQGGRDVSELAGITVPVKLTGALDSPQWSIDFAGMVTDIAKQRLQDEVLKRITPGGKAADAGAASAQKSKREGLEGAVKEGLRGILGR